MHIPEFLHSILDFFRPPHVEPRWHAATKAENRAARALAIGRRLELEIMAIHMTPEQREAAKARATQRLMRVVGRVG